ncbi:cell division control protein 45 homolog isoform X2 [Aplysia californica]|uniref:Cell division control protein 45 homolog isoform X2 n=1 Tax=Aplysia californica TaxID=6500 RepID=A0ABM1VWH9_APLCA|nr:cell division control protein 45 homolog isoform X2 [Aplysia californica]
MLIKDFRRDFYDVLQHQRVLILVAFDVDALCACKILQYLFQCDQVLYTVVPVNGLQGVENAFLENAEGIKHVILINCGASVDIVELLQPEDNVRFYICDSHRPVDIHNYYNAVQVKLLMRGEELSVPSYDEVFRDDESSESDTENDDPELGGKKKRFDDEAILRRQERRRWKENRVKLLFDYTKFTSFGTSAALVMFELAWKLSKDTNNLLWLAIVGVTDQQIHYRTPREKYMEDVLALQVHVSRHNQRGDDDENLLSVNCLRVSFEEELHLSLYRHWSLFDSICHSTSVACKLKLWSLKGQKKLHEFLAEMGLPLAQCKQQYSAMESTLKSEVKEKMQTFMHKYGLEIQDIILPSFTMQYGYKSVLCAADHVMMCAALLESIDKSKMLTDYFLDGTEVLQRSNQEKMDSGVDAAKHQLRSMVKQIQSFIDMHQIISAGPFLYVFIQEGAADSRFFSHPQCLIRLARFTLEAHCNVTRNKRARILPLILGAPLMNEEGSTLVVGIPPLDTDDERKNH